MVRRSAFAKVLSPNVDKRYYHNHYIVRSTHVICTCTYELIHVTLRTGYDAGTVPLPSPPDYFDGPQIIIRIIINTRIVRGGRFLAVSPHICTRTREMSCACVREYRNDMCARRPDARVVFPRDTLRDPIKIHETSPIRETDPFSAVVGEDGIK